MDLAGQTLGQFQIIEQVGKGGMAFVYRAYQPSLQRHVAIKVLAPKLADDMDLVKRFLREARSAAALQHPNVIVIHDVCSEGATHYIVTEFLEGMTLAQLLQQEGSLPQERILNIVCQIASALDYAHSRGYIHRDIKPSNIMVDPNRDDHVTLMDFGLVQVSGGSRITRTGFIMGTPDYMSPEQAKGDAIDLRTDIYSLGVTVYHMLIGEVPFVRSTPHAVLLAHIMEDPPAMATSDKEVPYEVEAVVRKSMSKDPNDRYDWAGDMANDLNAAITSPATFEVPPVRPSMYPQPATTVRPTVSDTPPTAARPLQTPPYGRAATVVQTPPRGVPPSVTPYPQAAPSKRRWIWPVVGLVSFAFLATVLVVAILLWPRIQDLIRDQATPTVALAGATATTVPKIQRFDVTPREINQGDSVTIQWEVTGVDTVTIRPSVLENGAKRGSMAHKPGGTTVYQLVLPNGDMEEVEVKVIAAPGAPVIEFFRADPQETVRGSRAELSWKVTGSTSTSKIEISANFQSNPVTAEGKMQVNADETTTYGLNACTGDLCDTAFVELIVVDPTPTATNTLVPTSTATGTAIPEPATSTPTPTAVPPTNTPRPRITSTPTPVIGSGVVHAFERWTPWKIGDQPYGTLTQSDEQVHKGAYAAKLAYDFGSATADDDFVVFTNPVSVGGRPDGIGVWVYGDGSGHLLNVWIEDAKKQVWSIALGEITFTGWTSLWGDIDATRPWPSGHVYGPQDGVIDFPVRFLGIVLDRPGSGPRTGQIYLDNIGFWTVGESTEATPTSAPVSGQIGSIIFTVKVAEDRYALYSTAPGWSKAAKIGDATYDNSTCVESAASATAVDGTAVRLHPLNRCEVAGTAGSCPSPNGAYKANTYNTGSGYTVTLLNVAANRDEQVHNVGALNIYPGLNWAPDSSHFLFTVEQSVYRMDVGRDGYRQVIPFKDREYPLQYSPDGTYVYYLKPVNGAISDIFVARPDGSEERNVTNAPSTVKLCPRWRR